MVVAAARRLQSDDWVRAALDAIAAGGLRAVSIEALAPVLGVSKGSFYWHFRDRASLIAAAVELWEETRTEAIIRELAGIVSPRERLQRLCVIAFGDEQAGRVEAALIARPDDPAVSAVVRRVTARRVAFLNATFLELGFDPRAARLRALAFYGSYLGLFVVRAGNPDAVPPEGGALEMFINDLVDLLTTSGGTPVDYPASAATLLLSLLEGEFRFDRAQRRARAYLDAAGAHTAADHELAAALADIVGRYSPPPAGPRAP